MSETIDTDVAVEALEILLAMEGRLPDGLGAPHERAVGNCSQQAFRSAVYANL